MPSDVLAVRYRILSPLGAGGMGEVFLAEDTRLERRVAVKMLPAAVEADAVAPERLRREALAAAGLDHPFICKVDEIGLADGRAFIVMEYVAADAAGLVEQSREHFETALRQAHDLPIRLLQPTVLYWHGRALSASADAADHARGRAMVEAALTDFRGLEMVLHANLAERFLREGR